MLEKVSGGIHSTMPPEPAPAAPAAQVAAASSAAEVEEEDDDCVFVMEDDAKVKNLPHARYDCRKRAAPQIPLPPTHPPVHRPHRRYRFPPALPAACPRFALTSGAEQTHCAHCWCGVCQARRPSSSST